MAMQDCTQVSKQLPTLDMQPPITEKQLPNAATMGEEQQGHCRAYVSASTQRLATLNSYTSANTKLAKATKSSDSFASTSSPQNSGKLSAHVDQMMFCSVQKGKAQPETDMNKYKDRPGRAGR
jgi:hypothetical protein